LTWKGRELQSYTYREISGFDEDGNPYYDNTTYSFTYNSDGIRTSKTALGIKHEYILNGSQILAEKWKIGSTEYLLIFLYDESGAPIGLKYRTSVYTSGEFNTFFFEKNLQGDIIAIYDETGSKIGSYTYDAWGNHTYSTVSGNTSLENRIVSTYNPFRYRGYYYDVETQWYYLQSRYYNPNWGRLLNADSALYDHMFGFNMYAYCYNNPVSYIDSTGENAEAILAEWLFSGGIIFIDGPLPIGDIIYFGSLIGFGVVIGIKSAQAPPRSIPGVQEDNPLSVVKMGRVTLKKFASAFGDEEILADEPQITCAKAGDGIAEHTNGKYWDKHSKKRAGGKEKKDGRMKPRQNKKKRNMNKFVGENSYELF